MVKSLILWRSSKYRNKGIAQPKAIVTSPPMGPTHQSFPVVIYLPFPSFESHPQILKSPDFPQWMSWKMPPWFLYYLPGPLAGNEGMKLWQYMMGIHSLIPYSGSVSHFLPIQKIVWRKKTAYFTLVCPGSFIIQMFSLNLRYPDKTWQNLALLPKLPLGIHFSFSSSSVFPPTKLNLRVQEVGPLPVRAAGSQPL